MRAAEKFGERTVGQHKIVQNPSNEEINVRQCETYEIAIRRSVSSHVFTSIVHAFVCSRIDYCNSLLVGPPKVQLPPIQSVLNAAARLIARLPRTSHISAFMFDHLHWLPLIARIQPKVLTLIYRSHISQVPRYVQ